MTLDQLRVFVAVAAHEHGTRAAEALHLAQSAASAAVAGLEQRTGVRLFDRVGRGIALTEAGRAFLPEARAVLARVEAAELALAELGGGRRGTLRVQASQTIASYWLPPRLVAYRRAHPGIVLRLVVGNSALVARAVAEGDVPVGFVEGVVEDPCLVRRVVARDRLVVVVGPGHPWAVAGPAPLAQPGESAWVLREPGSGTRAMFEAALMRQGMRLDGLEVALELPSNEAVRAAVEAGLGATAISALVAAPGLATGRLVQVPFDLPQRAFTMLRHADRTLSRSAQALWNLTEAIAMDA